MKSGGSGASSATRSPGMTPASLRPSAVAATRSASEANESDTPPPTAIAVAASNSRATSAPRSTPRSPAAGRGGGGAAASGAGNCAIHLSASAATSSSSTTRWPASGNRWSSACGSRARRSAAKARWKTGSRSPQARSTGTVSSDTRPATAANAAYDGWARVVGMSATKSAIACRSSADAYGAR